MSKEEVSVIEQLKAEQEESFQSREKLRKSSKERPSEDKPSTHLPSKESENHTQPQIVINQTQLLKKRTSIFGTRASNQNKPNIFASNKSVNLLNFASNNSQNSSANIFQLASKSEPTVKNGQQDELLSNSSLGLAEDNYKDQVLAEPTEKIMRYDYQETTYKIAQFKLVRFKNGANPTKQGVTLSLERDKKTQNKNIYFLLRNQAIKITIFKAFLLPNPKIQTFMGKEENLKLWVFHLPSLQEKAEDARELVKLQFQSVEQAKRFRSCMVMNDE